MRIRTFIITSSFLTILAPALHAQPVLVDISTCMSIPTGAEKYACYERLETAARALQSTPIGSAPQTTAVPPVPRTPATPPAAPRAATPEQPPAPPSPDEAVATFGTSTPSTARVLTSTDGEQELHDRITDLQEREPGRYVITLASGQVWYQTNSQRMRLRKDMNVRIYPSPLGGSYRMARDDGAETGFVQVERLK